MRTLRQREPRRHDAQHLAFVRSRPCCVCGSSRDVEAAHIRIACSAIGKPETGMQEKPDDAWTVSLCRYHHQTGILAQHKVGERRFWFEIHGRNPFEIAQRLWIESGGAARAAERAANPKPVKPRKIKPRDDTKPKRQIPARPAMQSRSQWPVGRKIPARVVERRT